MPVCKLILRFDYKLNFNIFDAASKIFPIFEMAGNDYWSGYRDNTQQREISALKQDDTNGVNLTITISPTTLNGVIISHKGLSFENLENDVTFNKFIKVTNSLRNEFEIFDIVRLGLRVFYFSNPDIPAVSVNKHFQKMIHSALITRLTSELGEIKDSGLSFDGENTDKTKYHFKCGPYFKGEAKKYIEYLPKEFDSSTNFNFISDVDIYEEQFTLNKNVSVSKWLNPYFMKLKKTLSFIETLVMNLCEE